MDAIMEQDNEDDAEDRIFFEVYKNYSHTWSSIIPYNIITIL